MDRLRLRDLRVAEDVVVVTGASGDVVVVAVAFELVAATAGGILSV